MCPGEIFMCPANICTSPVKLMYTAGKINTCPDWKTTCPPGHVTTKVYVAWNKIYIPWACGHALMSSPVQTKDHNKCSLRMGHKPADHHQWMQTISRTERNKVKKSKQLPLLISSVGKIIWGEFRKYMYATYWDLSAIIDIVKKTPY